jgi:predicted transposase YbfD/YdcC
MAEKDAALKCLEQLDLKGVTVTMDAGLNNRQIIDHILDNDGHYLTPVKKNHRSALRLLTELFASNDGEAATIEEKTHGRSDTRSCSVIPAEKLFVTFSESFPAAVTAIQMTRTRIEKDKSLMTRTKEEDGRWRLEKNQAETKETTSTVYYVSSQKITALEAIEWTRQHWGIENKLHWILDIAFREDDWMVRAKSAARSLSVARKIAFNLIKTSNTKGSVRARMKRASWNDDFLEQLVVRKF